MASGKRPIAFRNLAFEPLGEVRVPLERLTAEIEVPFVPEAPPASHAPILVS
jgi:hypothetical protein